MCVCLHFKSIDMKHLWRVWIKGSQVVKAVMRNIRFGTKVHLSRIDEELILL